MYKTLGDVIAIVKRRKNYLIWPAVGVFLLSAIIAFAWPPTYRSTSTILIEEQEIPREYVMTTVSSYAEQRLQTINQRIMSSTRLTEIINRFKLYEDLQGKWTMEEIIDKMRKKDIKFETDQRRRDRQAHGPAHGGHDCLFACPTRAATPLSSSRWPMCWPRSTSRRTCGCASSRPRAPRSSWRTSARSSRSSWPRSTSRSPPSSRRTSTPCRSWRSITSRSLTGSSSDIDRLNNQLKDAARKGELPAVPAGERPDSIPPTPTRTASGSCG